MEKWSFATVIIVGIMLLATAKAEKEIAMEQPQEVITADQILAGIYANQNLLKNLQCTIINDILFTSNDIFGHKSGQQEKDVIKVITGPNGITRIDRIFSDSVQYENWNGYYRIFRLDNFNNNKVIATLYSKQDDFLFCRNIFIFPNFNFISCLEWSVRSKIPCDVKYLSDGRIEMSLWTNPRYFKALINPHKGYSIEMLETYDKNQMNCKFSGEYVQYSGGVWLLTSGTYQQFDLDSGKMRDTVEMKFENATVNIPDFDPNLIKIDLPVGAEVTMNNSCQTVIIKDANDVKAIITEFLKKKKTDENDPNSKCGR